MRRSKAGKLAGHQHDMALLITDMLNTMQFPEAKKLLASATKAAQAIAKLKKKAKAQGIPVIYINDNFGLWQSDWKSVFDACTQDKCLGKKIAELLKPEEDDYFVLKPKHSGFYSTTLDILLEHLHAKTLILTGIAGNICVLFTANDAHMREFKVIVPKDCIASNSKADNDFALRQLKEVFGIRTPLSKRISLPKKRQT